MSKEKPSKVRDAMIDKVYQGGTTTADWLRLMQASAELTSGKAAPTPKDYSSRGRFNRLLNAAVKPQKSKEK